MSHYPPEEIKYQKKHYSDSICKISNVSLSTFCTLFVLFPFLSLRLNYQGFSPQCTQEENLESRGLLVTHPSSHGKNAVSDTNVIFYTSNSLTHTKSVAV